MLDVKGEIYDGTSRWRQQHVGPVIRFSPLDTGRTARFNPLAAVRSDSMNIWEDSLFLADMILVPPEQGGGGGGENRFWNDRAREVLRAVIADVVVLERAGRQADGQGREHHQPERLGRVRRSAAQESGARRHARRRCVAGRR